jgi:hypothetical protein
MKRDKQGERNGHKGGGERRSADLYETKRKGNWKS